MAALLSAAVCGCGLQPGGPQTDGASLAMAEALAGRRAAPALEQRFGGLFKDAVATGRLESVAGKIASWTPALGGHWQIRLLNSACPNAFSLPGGLVYLTRGLYERIGHDDALLAAAIAHEMAHVMARDSLKPAGRSRSEVIRRELDADARGAGYLEACGRGREDMARLVNLIRDDQAPDLAAARIAALAAPPAKP